MASPLGPDVPVALRPGGEAFIGVQQAITIPPPVAGSDWTFTFPSGAWWRVLLGHARFTTSAAAANRFPGLEIADADGNTIYDAATDGNVTAGLAQRIGFACGGPGAAKSSGVVTSIGLPDVLLQPGFMLRSNTTNLQGGDVWDQVRLFVEQVDIGRYAEAVGMTPYLRAILEGAG